jgi:hypothetical protein
MAMQHPVEVYTEDWSFKSLYKDFGIEFSVPEHTDGKVYDAYSIAEAFQIFGDAGEPDGVHLEDVRRRD